MNAVLSGAELEAMESHDGHLVAQGLAGVLHELGHGDGGVLHELLVHEAALLVEGAQLAGENLLEQVLGLALSDELSLGDLLLLSHEGGVEGAGVHALGSAGGDVQGDVLAHGLESLSRGGSSGVASHLQEHAHLATHVDVRGDGALAGQRVAAELAQLHVLTDDGALLGDVLLDRGAVDGHVESLVQRGGRRGLESSADLGGQSLELVTLGAEVRLAVDFVDDTVLAFHDGGHDAFLGFAVSLLGSLGDTLLAEVLDGFVHVAVALDESLLAVHHAGIGLDAQLLHHCGSNFSHCRMVFQVIIIGSGGLALVDGLYQDGEDQTDGAHGVVVARDGEVHAVGVGVGVGQHDHGNAQDVSLADGDVLVVSTDGDHHVGSATHVADTLKVALQLLAFASEGGELLLGHGLVLGLLVEVLEVVKTSDALLDGGHVGEHTAEPAEVHIVLTGSLSGLLHSLLSLTLAAHEENLLVLGGKIAEESAGLVQALLGFLQVDDVDTILLGENVLLHVRVPLAGLMTKVHTGFHHLRNEFVNHCICMCCASLAAGNADCWKVLRSRPQPSVVDIAASAGTRRILHLLLFVNQNH